MNKNTAPSAGYGLLVVTIVLSVYLLTAGGHLYGRDGVCMFFMTHGLVNEGDFAIPYNVNTQGGKPGLDGKYYSPYGIGQPLASSPFYMVGKFFTERTQFKYMSAFVVSLFNSFVGAVIALMLFQLLIILDFKQTPSVVTTMAAAFTTMLWPYSHYYYSEPLVTLCHLGTVLCILKTRVRDELIDKNRVYVYLFLAGLFAGYSVLVRPISVLFLPLFYLLLLMLSQHGVKVSLIRLLALFSLPIAICGSLVAWYNQARFGSIWDLGYGPLPNGAPQLFNFPFWEGLAIFLVSPGKSLFLFSPLVLLGMVGIPYLVKRHKQFTMFIVLLSLGYVLLYARWCQIEGGYSWGPRFLLPVIPFLLIPCAEFFSEWRRHGSIVKVTVILLITTGFIVQILALSVNFVEVIEANPTAYYNPQTARYSFDFSPLPEHMELLVTTLSGNKQRLVPFTMPVEQRRNLFVINLNWSDKLDFWFLHLYGDGVPVMLLAAIIILLATLFSMAGIILFRRLKRQTTVDKQIELKG